MQDHLPDLSSATIDDVDIIKPDPSMASDTILEAIRYRISSGIPAKHIYSQDLRLNGKMVSDSFESYLSSDHYQSSHLKNALITPLHFKYREDDDRIKLDSITEKNAFNLGTFIHQCILEPTLFSRVLVADTNHSSIESTQAAIDFWKNTINAQYEIFCPDGPLPPSLYIEACYQAVEKAGFSIKKIDGMRKLSNLLYQNSGLIAVSQENYLKIKILKKHLDHYAGGVVFNLLKHSKRETSFYYDSPDGIKLKVRPDAIQFEENIGVNAIISIKSTATEDLRSFYRHCAEYHYDLTEALYQDIISSVTGRPFSTTITIMLQTVEPYAVALLLWSPDDIEIGRAKYKIALENIKDAVSKNKYPGYESYSGNDLGIIPMALPVWNGRELLPQD